MNQSKYDEIFTVVKSGIDLDSINDKVSEIMINNRIRLNDQQVKEICDAYYNSGEKNAERLENSNQLFLQLHHTNGMVPQ